MKPLGIVLACVLALMVAYVLWGLFGSADSPSTLRDIQKGALERYTKSTWSDPQFLDVVAKEAKAARGAGHF